MVQLFDGMFMYGSSYTCCDGYEWVGFPPVFCIVLMSGSYLVCFYVMACYGNLSWQYEDSMSCNVVVGDGVMGVCVWLGAPIMHSMSGLSLARHWHGYLSIQFGIVWLGGLLLISPALASVNKQVFMLA